MDELGLGTKLTRRTLDSVASLNLKSDKRHLNAGFFQRLQI